MSGFGTRERGLPWTDARTELATQLWRDGLSCSQIAKKLGGVTRNAVIGKLHRMGLKRQTPSKAFGRVTAGARGFAQRSTPKTPRPNNLLAVNEARKALAAYERAEAARQRDADGKLGPLELSPSEPLLGTTPRPWTTRAFGECAYPFDAQGGETLSCCAKVKPKTPYCATHHLIMFRGAPEVRGATKKTDADHLTEWEAQRRAWVA